MLEALGNLGEFLGSIGVIASLIYLAIQVRQNTKTSRVAANQSVTSSYIDLNTRLSENEGLADVVRRGLRDADALSGPERGRFYSYLTSMILILANQYAMYRQGVLTEQDWEPARRRAAILVSTPGGAAWWNSGEGRGLVHPQFVAMLEEAVAERKAASSKRTEPSRSS